MTLSVYVATHKPMPVPADPAYIPLHCGAALRDDLGYLRDDTGDNISDKNPNYSELTGHYWAWKNCQSEFVGLVHYRRFFQANKDSILHSGINVASGNDLLNSLADFDIIVIQPLTFFHPNSQVSCSVEQQYAGTADFTDILQARRAVAKIDNRYLEAFDFVMRNNKLIAFNMFIASHEVFSRYSAWLFSVLFEIETLIPYASLTGYLARVPAFLGERLMTVWIAHNRPTLRVQHRPYLFYEHH